MSRIHLGNRSGVIGAWVSAPGQDASLAGDKQLLSSTGDQLLMHYYNDAIWPGFDAGSGFHFYQAAWEWDPLPHPPLFMLFSGENTYLRYPPSNWNGEPPNPTADSNGFSYTLSNSQLTLDAAYYQDPSTQFILYVFKNPVWGAL